MDEKRQQLLKAASEVADLFNKELEYGYWVATTLLTASGQVILIDNRGNAHTL